MGLATFAALFLVPAAAASAANTLHVKIDGAGAGEVITVGEEATEPTPPINCDYASPGPATGTCDAEAAEPEPGALATGMEAIPAPGSTFTGWTVEEGVRSGGSCEATPLCIVFAFVGEIKVKATFDVAAAPKFPLNLSTTGTGTGSIECDTGSGPEACAAEYPESTVVTLTQNAATGSEFIHWTGDCTGSGTCELTMDAAKSVDAQFDSVPINGITVTPEPAGPNCSAGGIKVESASGTTYVCNGQNGAPGTPGQGVTVTTESAGANCPNGGIKVVSGAGTTYVCNGTNGSNGSNGKDGTNGKDGANGAQGAAGSQGPAGPAGPQGAQGPAGPVGKVTCKVKGKSKVKVTCTVKQGASASSSPLRWRLMHGGKSYRHGTARHGRLQLDLGHMSAGRYVLRTQGKATLIVVG